MHTYVVKVLQEKSKHLSILKVFKCISVVDIRTIYWGRVHFPWNKIRSVASMTKSWNERGSDFTPAQLIPLNSFEPFVAFDVIYAAGHTSDAFAHISAQQTSDKVAGIRVHAPRVLHIPVQNASINGSDILVVKWRIPGQHLKDQYAQGIVIHRNAVTTSIHPPLSIHNHFRSYKSK